MAVPSHHRRSVALTAAVVKALTASVLPAALPVWAADFRLAPVVASGQPLPAGRVAPAELQRKLLVAGDRVLLACGERYTPLRLQTHGAGAVRIEAATACADGQRPVFDGRHPVGDAGPDGRLVLTQAVPVVQVFASEDLLVRARFPAKGYLVLGSRTVASDAVVPADARIDGLSLAGATLVARTQEWTLETRLVGADGRQLDKPLRYPLRPRAGVYFTGKAWMLGKGAGWTYDYGMKLLTVQGAAGRPLSVALDEPLLQVHGSAGVVVHGIDLHASGGNALDLKSSGEVILRDVTVTLAGGHAVAVAGARQAVVERLRVQRSGGDAVFFAEVGRAEVRDSAVQDAGMLPTDATPLAAINAHRTDSALIERNRIDRAAYIGIRVAGDALVQGNRVADSCLSLADCAAIYTWRRGRDDHRPPVRVLGNLIVGVGVGTDTSVKFGINDYFSGIYFDEWTRRGDVRGNVVIDAAQGIYLHNSFDNEVAGNVVLGGRAQPLVDLVDPPVRAALATDSAELPNRLQGALLESTATVGQWARVAADDVAGMRAVSSRVVVVDGVQKAQARPVAESAGRRCVRLLPLPDAAQLPGQVLACSTN